jgi:ribosomal protein L34E
LLTSLLRVLRVQRQHRVFHYKAVTWEICGAADLAVTTRRLTAIRRIEKSRQLVERIVGGLTSCDQAQEDDTGSKRAKVRRILP